MAGVPVYDLREGSKLCELATYTYMHGVCHHSSELVVSFCNTINVYCTVLPLLPLSTSSSPSPSPCQQILTDEDDIAYPQIHSSSSSGSGENEPSPPPELTASEKVPRKSRKDKLVKTGDRSSEGFNGPPVHLPLSFASPHHHLHQPHIRTGYEHLPIVYAPHSSNPGLANPVQQYRCKYPGCNQVCACEHTYYNSTACVYVYM